MAPGISTLTYLLTYLLIKDDVSAAETHKSGQYCPEAYAAAYLGFQSTTGVARSPRDGSPQ